MTAQHDADRPVVVIGAGPVGLAAAAHLVSRGLPVRVYEAGTSVAAHLEQVRHVRLFSPWRYDMDTAARELLQATDWPVPDEEAMPTAGELVDLYLRPLSEHPDLSPFIHFNARVVAISRHGIDKAKTAGRDKADFLVRVSTAGGLIEQRARAVIDASGTWSQPNPVGAHGLPAVGEPQARAQLSYGMPDILGTERARFAGRRVLVVGAGHSAAGNLLALAELAEADSRTHIVWAVRGHDLRRLFGGGSRDGLPARGELGTRLQALVREGRLELRTGFAIRAIERVGDTLTVHAIDSQRASIAGVHEIVTATGSRPDLALARELRARFDPWLESTEALAPLIDPNEHSCGTVRPHGHRELAHPQEPGFYAIGAKSYGRAPNFLLATGYEQARSVVAALAGDWVAADDVQLVLPETGVCSVDLAGQAPEVGAACCGGPPKTDASACCAADESAKTQGQAGCGCGPRASAPSKPRTVACCG